MIINVYKNSSEANSLDKNLTLLGDFSGVLKEETSVINPTILVSTNDINICHANYMYISEFERRYFINNIESIRNGLWALHCHVDVLSTYKGNIRNLQAVVRRQRNKYNLFLDDPEFKSYVNTFEQTLLFPNGVSSTGKNYLLLTSGG